MLKFIRDEQFAKNNFDLVRLAAALLVVYGHAYAIMPPQTYEDVMKVIGFAPAHRVGLYMFFLVSGFLVTRAIEARRDYRFFIKSRLLRLVPGLCVSAVVTLALVAPYSSWHIVNTSHWRDAMLYVIANSTLFSPIAGVDGFGIFQNNPLPNVINGSLWSIALEARLYFLLLLLHASGALTSSGKIKTATYTLIAIGLFAKSEWLGLRPDSVHLTCAAYFYAGSLSYQLKHYIPTSPIVPATLFMSCLTIVLLSAQVPDELRRYIAHATVYFFVFALAFGSRPISLPGDYSYGIYLYSFPIQQIIAAEFPNISPGLAFGLSMTIILPAGVLSWHCVEERALKLKKKQSSSLIFLTIAFAISFVVAQRWMGTDMLPLLALLLLALASRSVLAVARTRK